MNYKSISCNKQFVMTIIRREIMQNHIIWGEKKIPLCYAPNHVFIA